MTYSQCPPCMSRQFRRYSTMVLLPLILALPWATLGADPVVDSESGFKAAYASYQSLIAGGKYEEAIPHAQRALELRKAALGENHREVAVLTLNLGSCLRRGGQVERAVPVLRDAVELFEESLGSKSMHMVDPLVELGHALVQSGSRTPYRQHYERALRIIRNHEGSDSRLYGDVAMEIGEQIVFIGQDVYGRRYLDQARDTLARTLGPEHQRTGLALFNLGKFELATENPAAAEPLLTDALRIFEAIGEPGDRMELIAHAFLSNVYDQLGNSAAAGVHVQAIGRLAAGSTGDTLAPLVQREPEYPLAARRARATGFVDVEFTVDESGQVHDALVVDSDGHRDFPAAALKAIMGFRFAPRYVDGQFLATPGVRHRFTFSPAVQADRTRCERVKNLSIALGKASAATYSRHMGMTPAIGASFDNDLECP